MELEMRRIHRERGDTFLYVTHNQDQALKLADKLVVMNQGMLEQVATPEEVYANPTTAFVGRFVGDSNPLLGNVVDDDGDAAVVDTNVGRIRATPRYDLPAEGTEVVVLVRPEDMRLGGEAADCDNTVPATVEGRTYTGEHTEFTVAVEGSEEDFQVVKSGNVPRESVDTETTVGWNREDGIAHDQLSVSDTVTVGDLLEV
jgi:ABC-type Fe3+/spermidine/putrescine transport system ATPase subunit